MITLLSFKGDSYIGQSFHKDIISLCIVVAKEGKHDAANRWLKVYPGLDRSYEGFFSPMDQSTIWHRLMPY